VTEVTILVTRSWGGG